MRIATRYLVRPMTLADVPQVMEIERESFPAIWPPTAFKRELQQNRLAQYIVVLEKNPAFVGDRQVPQPEHQSGRLGRLFGELRQMLGAEEDEELPPPDERAELVLGFAGVWLLPDEAHLVTIAVRESHRRQGIGEMLLISAIELAQEVVQPMVTLECRVSNQAALALYEKYGLRQVGLRPRYYSDNQEDALILTVDSVLTRRYRELLQTLKSQHRQRWGDFEVERS